MFVDFFGTITHEFTSPRTYNELHYIVMHQTGYLSNDATKNHQQFYWSRTLAPANKNDKNDSTLMNIIKLWSFSQM